MEEQTSFFGVKGLFYYKISYGLGYDAAPSNDNESSLGIYELVDIYKNDPFSYTSISVLRSVGMEVFPNLFS
jgi:hypothetical protein